MINESEKRKTKTKNENEKRKMKVKNENEKRKMKVKNEKRRIKMKNEKMVNVEWHILHSDMSGLWDYIFTS
jgi:hypothetical protein